MGEFVTNSQQNSYIQKPWSNKTESLQIALRCPNALTYYNLFVLYIIIIESDVNFLKHTHTPQIKPFKLDSSSSSAYAYAYPFHILMPFYTILMLYYFHTLMPFPYPDTFSIAWHYFNTIMPFPYPATFPTPFSEAIFQLR